MKGNKNITKQKGMKAPLMKPESFTGATAGDSIVTDPCKPKPIMSDCKRLYRDGAM
jgi:hypothetical protein